MQFSFLKEFDREFARLARKYRTLNDDIKRLHKYLHINPRGYPPGVVRISGLGLKTEIYKVKHFRCKALKGKGSRSGIRIIYAYIPEQQDLIFAEIYYKEKDGTDCNKERLKRYFD